MVTKRTGRPRGRPNLPIKEDRYRYLLTYYEARCRIEDDKAISRRKLALNIVSALEGDLILDPENFNNYRDDKPFRVRWSGRSRVKGDAGSKEARNKTIFHPVADDFLRKARKFNALPLTTPDGKWWHIISNAWAVTLLQVRNVATPGADTITQDVADGCHSIGELEFYNRVLRRYFETRFLGKPLPLFSLPDFIPHDQE